MVHRVDRGMPELCRKMVQRGVPPAENRVLLTALPTARGKVCARCGVGSDTRGNGCGLGGIDKGVDERFVYIQLAEGTQQ